MKRSEIHVTELAPGKFGAQVNGVPIMKPHTPGQQAQFSSKRNARRAARMSIERRRRGFLI